MFKHLFYRLGMSKPRRDRMWPRRPTTRHAWMLEGYEPSAQPREVLVARWRERRTMAGTRWTAYVIYCVTVEGEEDPAIVQRWVPGEWLRSARTDPNKAFGLR